MTNTQNDSHAHVSNLQTLGHCPACTDDSHADGNDSLTKAIGIALFALVAAWLVALALGLALDGGTNA